MNLAAKIHHQLVFFTDQLALPLPAILVALAAMLALAVNRARHA